MAAGPSFDDDAKSKSLLPTSETSHGRDIRAPGPTDAGAATAETSTRGKGAWWKVYLFRGMIDDVRRRAPYYARDWLDAWDYRVVPATVYMYFANILPALAFSLDMFQNTDSNYGVNEVLLASVLGSVVFSLFAAQPLTIAGVTGPITVFNYTVYDIMKPTGVNYIAFMAWIGIWGLILHWILAITNSCNWLRWVTRFPCDTFGFYVAFIYLQKGVQVLSRLGNDSSFYLSIMVALLVFMIAYLAGVMGGSSLFRHRLRVFLKDYGTPLTIIFITGFVHIGRMNSVKLQVLPTSIAFEPTSGRPWLVHFWSLSAGEIFQALPFAVLLTILFWFDHNVSSLMAQGSEFPLRKPAGFHWDLFLLGVTTGVAGILGLPFPNGLIPQAPFHTQSLCVTKAVKEVDEKGEETGGYSFEATHVVEQRVSNLAQGLLTLGTMSGPLLVVLHLIPHGVLAGLFFIMGIQALEANGITAKILFLARDNALTPGNHPLKRIERRGAIWAFVLIEVACFAATFAITQTIAAIGFPVIILALIPIRALILPRFFRREELTTLDAPTASDFIMKAIGGSFGKAGEGDSSDRSGEDTAVGTRPPSEYHDGDRGSERGDGIFAASGASRRSREDRAELGQMQSGDGTTAGVIHRSNPQGQ